ncbi:MAG: sigma 54-interacting transcriptional regulator [Deltaproteobacteria bacterium]|nr:sigma 54-interacting transcriptional regulator [Deltaproteobacteria bacterium]
MGDSELLAGRYRHVREIGRGASGRVIEVLDEASSPPTALALKAVAPADAARLALEAERLRAVSHPGLVAVRELLRLDAPLPPPFGLPAGTALLVEELAPGVQSSDALLGLDDDARIRIAVTAAHGVASALAALHGAGLVHGDVKPANVLLDTEHGVHLVDLGLAGPAVDAGSVRGSPAFLAPEGLLGTRSPATDLYALGVTLHRWLGGALPAHPGAPLAPSSVAAAVIARLTAPLAVDRPASARETVGILADLGRELGLELERRTLAATGEERALRATALSFRAPESLVERLVMALEDGGVVSVGGPPGSGRSRLVREAVSHLQQRRAAGGERVPTYLRDPRGDPPSSEAIVHLTDGDVARAERWARSARIARIRQTIVVEVEGEAALAMAPLPAEPFAALLEDLLGEPPSAAQLRSARDATGGLAGRLVRLFAETWRAGEDPSSTDVLGARGAATADEVWLPDPAREAAVRLGLVGGVAPTETLDVVREGLASLVRMGGASVGDDGLVRLRSDLLRAFAEHGTAKRRAALARSLEPFDARSAAYLAAHRGEPATDAFAAVARRALDAGDTAGAERSLEDGLRLVGSDRGLRTLLYEARLAAGRYRQAAEAAPSDALAAEALRRSGRLDDARARLASVADDEALVTRGWLALASADLGAAERFAREGDSPTLVAWVALARGEPEGAVAVIRDALGGALPRREAARAWSTLGAAHHQLGDRASARDSHRRSLELARALGERHLEASALGNLGAAHLELGELSPALDDLEESARRLAMLGRDRDLARALANLASAAVVLGDDDAAEGWVEEAARTEAKEPDAVTARHLQGIRAELALRRGDLARARRAAAEAAEDPRWLPRMVALLARQDASWASRWSGDTATFDGALATARVGVATGDLDAARAALAAAEPADWTQSLEHAFAALDLAEAARDHEGAREAAARARSLLDAGARTLDPERRARMRRAPRHLRVLGAGATESRAPISDGRWRRLGALAKRLSRVEDPSALRAVVVEAALSLVDAERALLVRRSDEGALEVVARAGVGADDAPSRSVVGRTLAGRAPVVSMDALADEALDQAASVHAMALRSVLSVPLRDRPEVLYMDDRMRTGVFDADDRRLLLDLADLAAIALVGAERLAREHDAKERLARANRQLEQRVRAQERELAQLRPARDGTIVARSPGMRAALDLAMRVADADVPVLITGESGTGKELLARAIHERGPRASAPFVAESCAALPDALVESLLFGHVRGAFTGASEGRAGLFRAADGGTLFLDEIGEMSPAMQAKILRVLQEGEVRPVGGTDAFTVDVRLLSATHRPLERWVEERRFREDLFYRIAVMRIELPPLRERTADIPPLVRRFIARHGSPSTTVAEDAMAALLAHGWPGNVRELENEVRRALLDEPDEVTLAHLSDGVRGASGDPLDLKAQMAALEERLIREALVRTEGNRTQAAQILGVSRYGLQKMLKRLAIE